MEKLVLIFLAFSFLLRSEVESISKIQGNSSTVYVGVYTGHVFSENIDTPAFRTDDYDNPDIELTESPVKRYTETTQGNLATNRPAAKTRTMYHPLFYDLPPPYSHC
ncbi:hypothetical protein [Maribellus sp. YY47]|uniref:hypothetical protein n=1 Tax=Maribellus sp. YY47 TaxID=2929486 RepID=UPI00200169E3|nr:hypothetical protein [Maribellus sp. YY47]MCK3685214.1 hypothetical protein [Maribellus sp. YY47]